MIITLFVLFSTLFLSLDALEKVYHVDKSTEKFIKLQSNPSEYRESLFVVKIRRKAKYTKDELEKRYGKKEKQYVIHSDWVFRLEDSLFLIKSNYSIDSITGTSNRDNLTIRLIKDFLKEDHCILFESLRSLTNIILKIHCNKTKKEIQSQEEYKYEWDYALNKYSKVKNKQENEDKVVLGTELLIPFTLRHLLSINYKEGGVLVNQNIEVKRPDFFENTGSYEHMIEVLDFKRLSEDVKVEVLRHKPYLRVPINYETDVFSETSAPWGLDRVDQRFGPLDTVYHYLSQTTGNIKVYIIDTGIRTTHVEFGGRAHFSYNAVGDGINTDCNGHGTHVAGIIGSQTYGVDKFCQLYAIKVLGCSGEGTLFGIQEGVEFILENTNSTSSDDGIVNLSLGGTQSSILDDAILSLTQNGLFVTVSAGNEGQDACLYSPADLGSLTGSAIFSVGASTQSDSKPSFSNFGQCVTISAPGQSILSTFSTSDTATQVLSGTSMSSPFVAGVASLVWKMNNTLTALQVKHIIQRWATPNITTGTTPVGGGKNLLFSLITDFADDGISPPILLTTSPTNPVPVSTTITPPKPPPVSTPSTGNINTTHGFFITMIMIFVLWV